MMYGGWGRENYGTTPTKVDALEVRGSPEELSLHNPAASCFGCQGCPLSL